jgi:hypothetical protein
MIKANQGTKADRDPVHAIANRYKETVASAKAKLSIMDDAMRIPREQLSERL